MRKGLFPQRTRARTGSPSLSRDGAFVSPKATLIPQSCMKNLISFQSELIMHRGTTGGDSRMAYVTSRCMRGDTSSPSLSVCLSSIAACVLTKDKMVNHWDIDGFLNSRKSQHILNCPFDTAASSTIFKSPVCCLPSASLGSSTDLFLQRL